VTVRILHGDCRTVLPTLPEASVHCCITSPPYWGLRDYGADGQIGLEAVWTDYVDLMVGVFAEVRRVLRDDGVLWLNLGDCFATGAGAVGDHPGGGAQGQKWAGMGGSRGVGLPAHNGRGVHTARNSGKAKDRIEATGPMTQPNRMPQPSLKPKDLVGIPWAVAFALRADGWYLRQALPWIKRNGMPESTRDRPIQTVETVFLLSKSERYFYDYDAVKRPAVGLTAHDLTGTGLSAPGQTRQGGNRSGNKERKPASARGVPIDTGGATNGAVAGSVPWEGTDRAFRANDLLLASIEPPHGLISSASGEPLAVDAITKPFNEAHFATFPTDLIDPLILAGCPKGGVVLDPFGGAGTTGLVATNHGRDAILIELNPTYADMADRRIHGALFAGPAVTKVAP
jgi:DNA modification methylase